VRRATYAWWQATKWSSPTGRTAGSDTAHRSVASRQRVRNRLPDGGSTTGDGISVAVPAAGGVSPSRGIDPNNSCVYGWAGAANSRAAGATSRTFPWYITITRSLTSRHHGQAVADEQHRQVQGCLQVGQQVQDLGLDRHVQRRHRHVADDHLRFEHECAGDGDPLALAAGQFRSVAVAHRVRVEALRAHRVAGRGQAKGPGAAAPDAQRLGHDVEHRAPQG